MTGAPPRPQWACGGPQTWHLSYHRESRSREYHHPTAATLPTTTRAPGVWTVGPSTVARPPSLQQQLFLRETTLAEAQQLWQTL